IPAPLPLAPAPQRVRAHPKLWLPRQPAACRFPAAVLALARLGTETARRARGLGRPCSERSLALPRVWGTDGGSREAHGRRASAPFPARPGPCRMKRLSTARKLCVLGHDPLLCAWSPNKSLLPAWPSFLGAALLRYPKRLLVLRSLLHSTARLPRAPTPPRRDIQIAEGPRPPQARAAQFKRLYRKRAGAPCSRYPLRRKRASDRALAFIRTRAALPSNSGSYLDE